MAVVSQAGGLRLEDAPTAAPWASVAHSVRALRPFPGVLFLGLSLAWLGPMASPVVASSTPSWGLRSIDTMAMSKDRLRNQVPEASIQRELLTDRGTGANTVAIEVPYDPASSYSPPVTPGYEATWVNTAHALGLHVWFRSHWNSWQGDYNFPKETPTTSPTRALGTAGPVLDGQDTTSYLALTYHWILSHPSYFQNGDIFTPAAEPENAGIAPYCQGPCMFGSIAIFNQWLRDSMTVDRAAFASLHVKVRVGYWGNSGWIATHGYLTQATVHAMGVLSVDDYFQSPAALVANLAQIEATYQVPVVVGEWGDIWDSGNQTLMVPEVNSVMAAVSRLNYVIGFNYFRDIGYSQGEGILNPSTLQLNASGLVVTHWFNLMAAPVGAPAVEPSPRSRPAPVASSVPTLKPSLPPAGHTPPLVPAGIARTGPGPGVVPRSPTLDAAAAALRVPAVTRQGRATPTAALLWIAVLAIGLLVVRPWRDRRRSWARHWGAGPVIR